MKKNVFFPAVIIGLFLTACSHDQPDNPPTSENKTQGTSANLPETNQLNIYNWSDYVDPETVTAFEKENQIKIRYDYYDSNETLQAKVLTGKSGYDLVAPSISSVGRQIKAGAYQKIHKELIPNYHNINPKLLELMNQVDPDNLYAVPYFWGINTIAINHDKVYKLLDNQLPENMWDLVFNPKYTSKLKSCGISFFDSPSEQFPLVLHYLGKDPNSSNPEDLKAATELIKTVRSDIKRFSSSGYIDDMARGDLCVSIGYGGDLNIAKNRAKEAKNGIHIDVLVPKQGVGIWIDSFMIPVDAENILNAHKYINYTLDPNVAAKNGNFVTYAPASEPAQKLMNAEFINESSIFPSKEVMENSFVILPKNSEALNLSNRLWQQIKAGQ